MAVESGQWLIGQMNIQFDVLCSAHCPVYFTIFHMHAWFGLTVYIELYCTAIDKIIFGTRHSVPVPPSSTLTQQPKTDRFATFLLHSMAFRIQQGVFPAVFIAWPYPLRFTIKFVSAQHHPLSFMPCIIFSTTNQKLHFDCFANINFSVCVFFTRGKLSDCLFFCYLPIHYLIFFDVLMVLFARRQVESWKAGQVAPLYFSFFACLCMLLMHVVYKDVVIVKICI